MVDACLWMSAARGENEYRELALFPLAKDKALNNARLSVSDFTCRVSGTKLDTVRVGPVGYVTSESFLHKGTHEVPGIMLWDKSGFTVSPGQLQSIFILLDTDSETAAGLYEGSIEIQPEGMPKEQIHVQVKIWDFILPDESSIKIYFSGVKPACFWITRYRVLGGNHRLHRIQRREAIPRRLSTLPNSSGKRWKNR